MPNKHCLTDIASLLKINIVYRLKLFQGNKTKNINYFSTMWNFDIVKLASLIRLKYCRQTKREWYWQNWSHGEKERERKRWTDWDWQEQFKTYRYAAKF